MKPQPTPSDRRPTARGLTLLAGGLAGLAFSVLGCGGDRSVEESVGEIQGTPIVKLTAAAPPEAGKSNAPGAPRSAASTALVSAAANPPVTAQAKDEPEFVPAGFEILSGYEIEISDELLGPVTNNLAEISSRTEALIPAKVKAFNQKKVSLKGFMLPLKVEGGLVTEMLVMKDQSMCCFGSTPKIHEWVSIKMGEKGVKPLMDQPVTLLGKLHVGEMRENGYLTGIYRMDGEKMAATEGE